MELAIHNIIEGKLLALLGEQYEGKHLEYDFMVFHIHKSRIAEALELLKTGPGIEFSFPDYSLRFSFSGKQGC
ncbi:MAG: hypothetical protein IPI60_18685 [Saprospiraceae bacterium]|nr:hypothetical protein [Saprospiraceae bacterium]